MALVHPDPYSEVEAPQLRRWTVREFIRLNKLGFLGNEDEHWELLDGEIVKKMGQGEPHVFGVLLAMDALRVAFGEGFFLAPQLPLLWGQVDGPEPDLTLVSGKTRDYEVRKLLTSDVALVVEVANTRLDTARGKKVGGYARLGIVEYWIVDLQGRSLEVRRGPQPETDNWIETRIYKEGESVTPLRAATPVSVDSLLPRKAATDKRSKKS
jgi:Uma2 family endonuclease